MLRSQTRSLFGGHQAHAADLSAPQQAATCPGFSGKQHLNRPAKPASQPAAKRRLNLQTLNPHKRFFPNRFVSGITIRTMLKAGVTGNIGSGKTTVCRIFESMMVPVYYADERAKALMTEDEAVRRQIVELLGPEAYRPDGSLNRARIAEQVFADEALLQKLNAIVHPAVHRDLQAWFRQQEAIGHPYAIEEAALLFESGGYKMLDKIIVVVAPEAERIRRVMERDGLSEAQVRARMEKQWPEASKAGMADFVIVNDGAHPLPEQVARIHRLLLEEAKARLN